MAWKPHSKRSDSDAGCDHRGGRRAGKDAALAFAAFALQQTNVALLTPGFPPRVFNLPVFHTVLNTVADRGHAMIQICTAKIGLDDAPGVKLEHGVGLDSD